MILYSWFLPLNIFFVQLILLDKYTTDKVGLISVMRELFNKEIICHKILLVFNVLNKVQYFQINLLFYILLNQFTGFDIIRFNSTFNLYIFRDLRN